MTARIGDTKHSEYGSLMVLTSRSQDREDCVCLTQRHGAWLVSAFLTDRTEDATPDELYDAAASLSTAKRLAREMASNFGYTGATRWRIDSPGRWTLTMTNVHEDWRYAEEEDN